MRRFIPLLAALALAVGFLPVASASAATCSTVQVGLANLPPTDPEPTTPMWCNQLAAAPPATGMNDGFGGYSDSFQNGVSGTAPAAISPSQYVLQDRAGVDSGLTEHWTMNGYWGSDAAKTGTFDGDDLSPAESFSFQNGKLVLEGDVAAATPGFVDGNGADNVWAEMDWSTRQLQDPSNTNDALYSYGYYKGAWAAGCRLQASRSVTCAVEADHDLASTTGDQAPCFSDPPARVMEISGFQQCGSTHSGMSVSFGAPANAWRVCPRGQVDPCLDRFRLEWSATGLVVYVNGIKFGEDSGWDKTVGFALPPAIVDGATPVYAHFSDWGVFKDPNVYRFHWQRVAVNPHNGDGTPAGPTASPTFGTKPPPPTPTPSPTATPTPTPTATPSPSPTPSASPTPSPTPSPSPTPTPAPTPYACSLTGLGSTIAGSCLANPDGTTTFTPA